MDKILFERKVAYKGNSPGLTIPPELLNFIGAEIGDILVLTGDKGKHGKYMAIYKKKEE